MPAACKVKRMASIAFIGAGRMASAMVGGLLKSGVTASDIACTCGDDPTGPALAERTGIRYQPDVIEMVRGADTIVAACKPQQFDQLDAALGDLARGKLLLSILAGTTIERLRSKFSGARNIVRSMPNTPGQIGAGITAYAAHEPLTDDDQRITEQVLGALGAVIALPEAQLDAVTAVSGSGPAYVFEFTLALAAGGVEAGLPADVAMQLAKQTVFGAALLMEQSSDNAETLRNNVTSPGGTTQAALKSLAADDFREIIERAVQAAKRRSIELAG